MALVIDANKQTNITRITTVEQGNLLHIEDSLAGLEEVLKAPVGPLADLGSGAGYPGIPLAIMTERRVTLVESVGKKADLLSSFIDELGLSDRVDVYKGRVEELSATGTAFSVITARALSSLPSLMELASPLLEEGGWLICYKSSDIESEMNTALQLQEKLAMYHLSTREVVLSDGETPRSIVVFRKQGTPLVKLPRKTGQAQKHPYRK